LAPLVGYKFWLESACLLKLLFFLLMDSLSEKFKTVTLFNSLVVKLLKNITFLILIHSPELGEYLGMKSLNVCLTHHEKVTEGSFFVPVLSTAATKHKRRFFCSLID
jgi:hypothetical protein